MTNAKFAGHFESWAAGLRRSQISISVLRSSTIGSTDDSNKLGAIGDLHLVITKHEIDEDIIVIGGDNLFSNDLAGFGELLRTEESARDGRLRRRRS